ncbi:MAG: glycosyl hydrolase family 18 protein [bacterium]
MTRKWRKAMTLVALVCATQPFAQETHAQHSFERLFYYIDEKQSYTSLQRHIKEIDIIGAGSYSVDENGVIWGDVDRRVLTLARQNGVKVMPLLVNPGFKQDMLSKLLSDSTARQRAVATMLNLCRENSFYGMQFDFENLHLSDRDAYTEFYREAAQALHKENFKISVAVVHRPEENPGPNQYFKWLFSSWRAGYDIKALAEIGDFVSVMTYSQHTRRTPPGPNAGIPWVTKNIEYFLKTVPPEKLSLGIPLGSQHWHVVHDDEKYVANARSWSDNLDYEWAMGKAERYGAKIMWHEEQQVPFTFFENGGLFEYIFFEDARSFRAKLALMEKYNLRGFSAWVLGNEDAEIWKVLAEKK